MAALLSRGCVPNDGHVPVPGVIVVPDECRAVGANVVGPGWFAVWFAILFQAER
jgi:hypothetical protein